MLHPVLTCFLLILKKNLKLLLVSRRPGALHGRVGFFFLQSTQQFRLYGEHVPTIIYSLCIVINYVHTLLLFTHWKYSQGIRTNSFFSVCKHNCWITSTPTNNTNKSTRQKNKRILRDFHLKKIYCFVFTQTVDSKSLNNKNIWTYLLQMYCYEKFYLQFIYMRLLRSS